MKKFLISGIGGDMGQCISKIIKSEIKDSFVVGLDITQRNAGKFFCDKMELTLRANDVAYIDSIENLIETYKIDFFIPCTEHELRALQKLPADHPLWKKSICCSKDILTVCLDKLETFNFLRKKGINTPWFTEDKNEIASYPCIYKKKSSSGSRDIFKIANKSEAEFIQSFSKDSLFQEFLPNDDQEYTCSIFQWNDGTFETIQLLRTLTGGSTSWAKVVKDESIEKLCRDVAQAFNLNGSLNIQLRMTDNGPMIFEINPRFSSTVFMRHKIGFKDLLWSIQKFYGLKQLDIPQIKVGIEIAKVSEIVIL